MAKYSCITYYCNDGALAWRPSYDFCSVLDKFTGRITIIVCNFFGFRVFEKAFVTPERAFPSVIISRRIKWNILMLSIIALALILCSCLLVDLFFKFLVFLQTNLNSFLLVLQVCFCHSFLSFDFFCSTYFLNSILQILEENSQEQV